MQMLSNMARFECTDESCFKLTTAQLKEMAERGDQRAVDELERRAHNRQHAQFTRASARGEEAKDPGFFVPPSLGGSVRSASHIVASTFPENEIQGVMRIMGISRDKAIQVLQKCEMHQRRSGG